VSDIILGVTPRPMVLDLDADADFVCTLVAQDGDWPPTATISIEVADQTWTATLAGPEARFNVDKAQVQAVIDQVGDQLARFKLLYVDGDTELTWGRGPVRVTR
jgi:hypothetical protein